MPRRKSLPHDRDFPAPFSPLDSVAGTAWSLVVVITTISYGSTVTLTLRSTFTGIAVGIIADFSVWSLVEFEDPPK